MSVINQVLNQLEQRGAHSAAEQPMVRAVSHTRRDSVMPLLAIGLVLIAGVAAWQWVSSRKPDVMPGSVAPKAGNPQPTEGWAELTPPKAENAQSSYELEKSAVQKQSAATTAAPASDVLAGDKPAESLAPASRLSFELSSVPLPSSLRPFNPSARPLVSSEAKGQGQALKGGRSSAAKKSVAGLKADAPAPSGRPQPIPATAAKVAAQASGSAVPMKQVSSAQLADAEFRRAAGLMQMGRIADAITGYEAALRLDAGHDAARQALVALLLEGKRNADAEKVLLEGLNSKPEHTGLTMLLARLQVERGALEQAISTLEKSLPFADTQADYRAFLAALLQRQNRNEEAVKHYQIVLQHAPGNGVWLMGYGISLQALQRNAEAKDAFQRALDTQTLSPQLRAFVQMRIKEL
jgi:MSHA biogenesis protein MshN